MCPRIDLGVWKTKESRCLCADTIDREIFAWERRRAAVRISRMERNKEYRENSIAPFPIIVIITCIIYLQKFHQIQTRHATIDCKIKILLLEKMDIIFRYFVICNFTYPKSAINVSSIQSLNLRLILFSFLPWRLLLFNLKWYPFLQSITT